ncbi:MAG: hypothetical protein WBG36_07345 [Ornithinimicrobium sp.]
MTDTKTMSRWIFRATLIVAIGSLVAMAGLGRWGDIVPFALLIALCVGARSADVPARFAAAFAVFMLLATWGKVGGWYEAIGWFDFAVHFVAPGALAAVAYFVAVQLGLFPDARHLAGTLRPSAVVAWVTANGCFWIIVWEYYEWVVEQFAPEGMIVGYTDTIGDLLAGMIGSAVAGLFVLQWARRQDPIKEKSAASRGHP